MEMATVQQLAVAFSAVVATFTFIYKVIDDRSSRKGKEILDWQKTVIHSIFQKSKTDWLSFEHIIGAYRGEAADVPGQNIPKDVLTSASLRKILISMVSERIIDQRGGDQYQLLTMNRDTFMQGIMTNIQEQAVGAMGELMKETFNRNSGKQDEFLRSILAMKQDKATENKIPIPDSDPKAS